MGKEAVSRGAMSRVVVRVPVKVLVLRVGFEVEHLQCSIIC